MFKTAVCVLSSNLALAFTISLKSFCLQFLVPRMRKLCEIDFILKQFGDDSAFFLSFLCGNIQLSIFSLWKLLLIYAVIC